MVPVKLRIYAGAQWSRRPIPLVPSASMIIIIFIHSLFRLLTFHLIFHIPGHFLLRIYGVEIDYWGYQDPIAER